MLHTFTAHECGDDLMKGLQIEKIGNIDVGKER